MTSSDYYDGWSYEGAAWSLAFQESWPLVTIALTGARRLGEQAVIDRMNEAIRDLPATYKYLPIKDYPWLWPDRPEVAPYFYDWIKHNTGTTIGSSGRSARATARSRYPPSTSAAGTTCS